MRPVMPPAAVPRSTYLSHRAKLVPTPRLVGRKRNNHGAFRHLERLGLGRPTAELAGFAPTPRQVRRMPGNSAVPGPERVGVSAEFMAPTADFRVEMRRHQIVDPERR